MMNDIQSSHDILMVKYITILEISYVILNEWDSFNEICNQEAEKYRYFFGTELEELQQNSLLRNGDSQNNYK